MRLSDQNISSVLKKALEKREFIQAEDTAAIFYDLSFLRNRIEQLKTLFPISALHAVAIKANPVISILKHVTKTGTGLEAATLPELFIAEKLPIPPQDIVYDSPTKTIAELEYALALGCHINADSIYELERIAALLGSMELSSHGDIGVRINPQVGAGSILSTSVADEYSKFGVPIREFDSDLFDLFRRYDWLNGVHVHIGSQGCSLDLLKNGISIVYDFVNELEQFCPRQDLRRRVEIFDIGGGLPAPYKEDPEIITMEDYSNMLREHFPALFSNNIKLITEFGRHIYANTGWVVSVVEYVKQGRDLDTAMIHVGADLFLRKCYRPNDWHHDVFVLDSAGNIKGGKKRVYNIAGPLCFAGDIIAERVELPLIDPGDYLVIKDTGAYTLSMWSRYNSRQIPVVLGYEDDGQLFEVLRKRETRHQLRDFWSQ